MSSTVSSEAAWQAPLATPIERLQYHRNQHEPSIPMILGFVLAGVMSGVLWALFLLAGSIVVTQLL